MQLGLSNARGFFRSSVSHLGGLLFPSRCQACRRLLRPGLAWCSDCWTGLSAAVSRPYCPSCAIGLGPHQSVNSRGRCPNCLKQSLVLDRVCRLGVYAGSLSRAVQHFKFHGAVHTGALLGDRLGALLSEQPWLGDVEALCPIPIHWTRRLDRGYNQSLILADRLARHVNRPVLELLKRRRVTPDQVGLSASARVKNVQGVFSVRFRGELTGASVCLVDDVMTTGATLAEAARTLRRAGVKHIYAAILAKADQTGYDGA